MQEPGHQLRIARLIWLDFTQELAGNSPRSSAYISRFFGKLFGYSP